MDFQSFTAKVKRATEDYLGDSCQVEIHKVTKNNGIRLYGMSIRQRGELTSPTIYLEPFYEEYEEGESLGNIIRQIVDRYEKHREEGEIDVSFFGDYTQVRTKLACKLIHTERNREMLQDVPHREFLDLSLVFYCMLIHESIGRGTVLIRTEFLDHWGISQEELEKDALENMKRILKPEVIGMGALMKQTMQEHIEEQLLSVLEENGEAEGWLARMVEEVAGNIAEKSREAQNEEQMYILTNTIRSNGAVYLLDTDLLAGFAREKGSGFMILPSSVHEIILVPEAKENLQEDICAFRHMVQEVNSTQVAAEEVLSDSVYYFDPQKQRVNLL